MKKFIVALIVLGLCTTSAFAGEIILNKDSKQNTGIVITGDSIQSRVAPSMQFECNVKKIDVTEIETPKGMFTQLDIPGFHHSKGIGAPSLPVMNKLVEVPFGAELSIKVIDSEVKEYTFAELGINHPVAPRQPSHPKDGTIVPFAYEEGAYMHKAYQQEELAQVEDLGIMRHIRLALVKIAPVAYNPVAQTLKVYSNVTVELSLKNTDMALTAQMKKDYSSLIFAGMESKVLTADSLKFKDANKEALGLLIVSDRMFEKELKPFIAWKIKKGLKVKTIYTDEFSKDKDLKESLKTKIHELYNKPAAGFPAPAFVLFVGDHDLIPAFKGTTGSHITDLNYVAVTGGDNIPEILTGRFSARTVAELAPQIKKTLVYEQYKMADPSYLKDVLMVAGWDYSHSVKWGYPQLKYGIKNYFNKKWGYDTVDLFLSAGSHQNESAILKVAKKGVSLINYTAHGSSTSWADPSFSISNINSLGNKEKYPLVIGNCCLTNKFEVGTCFGEAWLRAVDQGAIGYIGGTNSTYWDEDLWWGNGNFPIASNNPEGNPPLKEDTGEGAYDAVFTGEGVYPSGSGMILAGNLAVEESNSPRKKYYWEVYELMGDPSLLIYWGGTPKVNTVKHETELKEGTTTLSVNAADGSYVGISSNGTLHGAGYVDGGKATFSLNDLPKNGKLDIVVTKANFQPYIATVNIVK